MRGVFILASVLIAPALAGKCNKGLSYCGTGLLGRGYDQQKLVDALENVGQAGYSGIIKDSVYHCDNDSGDISFVTTCDVCKDAGTGRSDHCDTDRRTNCDYRFTYCGSTLNSRTGYSWQLESALRQAKQPTTSDFVNRSLFKCKDDGSGTVEYLTYCGKCVNAGPGNQDYCARDHSSNCAEGLAYCGFNLMGRDVNSGGGGSYYDRVSNALQGVFPDKSERDRKIGNSLFQCNGNGAVTALATCNCVDGGGGRSDYCISPSCGKGRNYCGKLLMKNNRAHRSTLADALAAAGKPTDNEHVENSIFSCEIDTQANKIKFLSFCGSDAGQCIDGGASSDHCQPKYCRIGIDYCGKTLLSKDPSYASIIGDGQLKSLYKCNGAVDGGVEFIRDCAQDGDCIDGGKFSDYCKH